jgi:hypothetical protein
MNVFAFLSDPSRGLVNAPFTRADRRGRGRPPLRLRLSLDSPEDVEAARRLGVPVYLLTSELVTALGYPVEFPPHLLVSERMQGAVDSAFPRIVVPSSEAVLRPGIEEVMVALLRIDALAARGVGVRNRTSLRAERLLRRVVQAEAEREATWVNLQEFASAIPKVGSALPQAWLEEQDRASVVEGLRA